MSVDQDGDWWVSTNKATGGVTVKDGKIVNVAHIWKRFHGQPFSNLCNWLAKRWPESFEVERMEP